MLKFEGRVQCVAVRSTLLYGCEIWVLVAWKCSVIDVCISSLGFGCSDRMNTVQVGNRVIDTCFENILSKGM